MSDKKALILGTFITITGNLIIFLFLNLINLDINQAFSLQHLARLSEPTTIMLIIGIAFFVSLTLNSFVFFKRRLDKNGTLLMIFAVIIFSGIGGYFLFKNLILSYIVYFFYSLSFLWIGISNDFAIKNKDDKKDLIKENIKKFGIIMSIAMIVCGIAFGVMNYEKYQDEVRNSIVSTTAMMISPEGTDPMQDFSFENLASAEEFEDYKKGKISDIEMHLMIKGRIENNVLFQKMGNTEQEKMLDNMLLSMKEHIKKYGDNAYLELQKSFDEWKNEITEQMASKIEIPKQKLFEMFPFLESIWLYIGALAFGLLSTFNFINGVVIRTFAVYFFSFMVQKDETIVNPKETGEVIYSERRQP